MVKNCLSCGWYYKGYKGVLTCQSSRVLTMEDDCWQSVEDVKEFKVRQSIESRSW